MIKKLLFTPGPLTTSKTVKEAALTDLGSRDAEFITLVSKIRKKLLILAHADDADYESVIVQGSGTFGIESVITSAVSHYGMLLNIVNGAYGKRISQIAKIHSIPLVELVYDENQIPEKAEIIELLEEYPQITHISIIHGETTTGLLNPLKEIGKLAASYKKAFIVDAMSTFGGYDINVMELNISFLISSSNKCIEGIPGFSFVIARKSDLMNCKNNQRTLSLDLYSQWEGLNSNGQFRFTPPVQVLLAFNRALSELELEGGIKAREMRYINNNFALTNGMKNLGFRLYLTDDVRSHIITSFLYPDDPGFSFENFYSALKRKGFIIYPGKLSEAECFRIGNIGHIFQKDIENLIDSVKEVLDELNIKIP
jgi:2-aminoethylphosphonate-pyruvate transaminase